jgi:stage II sporulation protein D
VPTSINVLFTNENKVYSVNLQNYLKGVVSAEIYASWHIEAHKAMAVAARTYAVARVRHPSTSPQAMVCTTTHCQAWTSNTNSNAEQGVNATDQVVIYYNGSRIAEPLYFAHCNGHTRNSEDYNGWNYIAYLRSKSCPCGYTSYYGHGVGACQWGLQAYAKQGSGYVQILQHYYTNVTVGK